MGQSQGRPMEQSETHIDWISPGVVLFSVGWRSVQVGGEALLEHNPDFMIYPRTIRNWENGEPVTEEERAKVLDLLIAAAARRGWRFEVATEAG